MQLAKNEFIRTSSIEMKVYSVTKPGWHQRVSSKLRVIITLKPSAP